MPRTLCHTGFIKLVCDTVKRIFACYCATGTAEETMPVLIYLYPSAGERTNLGIAPFTVDLNESGIFALVLAIVAEVIVNAVDCIDTGHFLAVYIVVIAVPAVCGGDAIPIFLTVCPHTVEQSAAAGALKHTVNEIIVMSCFGNSRTPVNYGVADLAEGSAGVTVFSAGGCLIFQSFCCMDMTAVPRIIIGLAFRGGNHVLGHLIHLGVHLRTLAGEGIGRAAHKGHEATVNLHADVDGPEFLHALELSIGICRLT